MTDVVIVDPIANTASNRVDAISSFTVGQGTGAFDLHLSRGWVKLGNYYYGRGPLLVVRQKITGKSMWGLRFGDSLASATNEGGVVPLTLRAGRWAARYSTNEIDWSEWAYHDNDFAHIGDAGQPLLTDLDPTETYWVEARCMMPPDGLNCTVKLERHRFPAQGGTGNVEHLGLVELQGIVSTDAGSFLDYDNSILQPFRVHIHGDSHADGFPMSSTLTPAQREGIRHVLRRTPSASLLTGNPGIATLSKLIAEGNAIEWATVLLDEFCGVNGLRLEPVNFSVAGRWQGGVMGSTLRTAYEGTNFPGLFEDLAANGWKNILNGGGVANEADITHANHWTGGVTDANGNAPHLIISTSFANDARIQGPIERLVAPGDAVFSSTAASGNFRDDLVAYVTAVRAEWASVRFLFTSDHLSQVTGIEVLEQIHEALGRGESVGSPPYFGFGEEGQADRSWGRYVDPTTDFDSATRDIIQRGLNGVGTLEGDDGIVVHFAEDQHAAYADALYPEVHGLAADIAAARYGYDFSVPANAAMYL